MKGGNGERRNYENGCQYNTDAALLTAIAGCAVHEQPVEMEPVQEVEKPQEGQVVFTRENFPRLDGSASTVPLAQALVAVLLSEDLGQLEDLVKFSRTTQSYRNLMMGNADLLLAAEPADSIWTEKKQSQFEWIMEPFAIDGLIFVVNSENPVDSLTVEQVQKIYTGEYTNWNQVGGADVPIAAFQRNAEAGSHTMMKKLVMDGLDMMEPEKEYVIGEMGALIEAGARL